MKRKFVLPLALAVATGLGVGATAQTTTLPAVQEIRLLVNFPNPQTNVTGFTVETICRDLTGLPAGAIWTQTFSFTAAGGSAKALYPLSASTSCVFRLTVLGTGARGIFGTGFIIGGAVRAVTFPSTVNGQAVDAQSVAESEPVAITRDTDAIFGVPLVVTATVPTTTIASTTTAATTTTRPPTTTAAATTTVATTVATTVGTTAATTQPTVATTKPASTAPTTKAAVKTRKVRRCTKAGKKTTCRTITVRVTH